VCEKGAMVWTTTRVFCNL